MAYLSPPLPRFFFPGRRLVGVKKGAVYTFYNYFKENTPLCEIRAVSSACATIDAVISSGNVPLVTCVDSPSTRARRGREIKSFNEFRFWMVAKSLFYIVISHYFFLTRGVLFFFAPKIASVLATAALFSLPKTTIRPGDGSYTPEAEEVCAGNHFAAWL